MKYRDTKDTNRNGARASGTAKSGGKHEDVVLTSSALVADGGRSVKPHTTDQSVENCSS